MSPMIAWQDPALPVPIEYSPEAMEWVRQRAFDGLMALPKVGLGVGGLLIGKRERSRILIAGSRPITCSHASGPSFHLTAAEIAKVAAFRPADGLEVVGCYCSRPRRPLWLRETDEALFRAICPAPGHLFLMIRPSATEPTRVGLFYRNDDGSLAGGSEIILVPWAAEEAPVEEPAGISIVRDEEPAQPRIPEGPPIVEAAPEPAPLPPQAPAAPFFGEPAPPAARLFGEPEPVPPPAFAQPPARAGIRWKTMGSAAAVIALAVGTWFTRDQLMPRPPLELHTAEVDGHFSLEWNRAAVRGLGAGRLLVTDGSTSHSIPLDRFQLEAGAFSYARQSPEVSAILEAGDARASAHFTAPPKPAPPPPPVEDPVPAPAVVAPPGTPK